MKFATVRKRGWKDRLAMGASLAVILANIWKKSWEPQLKLHTLKCKTKTQFSTCRNCEHRVTAHSSGVECEFSIVDSTQKVSKKVRQNMIAWKTKFGCAHSTVKMIRLTLTIHPQQKFF